MKLSHIIDIEYQLHRDAESDPARLRDRDRNIGMKYSGAKEDRSSMFCFWLENLKNGNLMPGHYFCSVLTFLRYSVFFFFLFSGALTCAGILAYDGSKPVNIVNFIAVFTGLHILFYLLFFLNLLPDYIRRRLPLIGDFYRFIGFVFRRIMDIAGTRFLKNRTKSISHISVVLNRVKSRHAIYQNIERWLLFSITQLGGFAFSLGALFVCTYLIIFSDLAFAWNTTLDVSPDTFQRIVTVISTPWSYFLNNLVPTIDLVESTRYFRLDGNYSGPHDSALAAGGWWPFMICILIFYGLIPRTVFLMLSGFKLLYVQNRAAWLSAELDSLYRRLTSPLYLSQSEEPDFTANNKEKQDVKKSNGCLTGAQSCFLIVWGELDIKDAEIRKIVKSVFDWDTNITLYAGLFDNLQDEETLKWFKDNPDTKPVLFIAESWEAPGKAVEHFLRHLRRNIKDNRSIVIGLVNIDQENKIAPPSQTDWQNWQNCIVRLNDPFIVIEPVIGAFE